jgi:peptidoglycan/LPS O-acetylase OafA/YrhL
MSLPPARRFWSLDALRGVCALVVFLSHWHLWAQFAPHGWMETAAHRAMDWILATFTAVAWPTGGNHPAVICFFVLSGFCIHYPFARATREQGGEKSWRLFYGRRFFRIMPVYWTAALMGFVLVSAEILHPSGSSLLAHHSDSSPADALIRLFAATDFVPREILAGNGPLSTVGIEIVLYALYPLFFLAVARGHWMPLGILSVALEGVGLILLPHFSPYWVYNSVFMYTIFWYAGALTAHYFVQNGTRSFARELIVTWIAFILLNQVPHFYGLSVLKQNLFGLLCVYVVLQCLHAETSHATVALKPPIHTLRYAGQVSYSLYVVHTPTLLLATWALIRLGVTSYSVQLLVTMASALTATLVVHYGIERVFYRPRGQSRPAAPGITRVTSPQSVA